MEVSLVHVDYEDPMEGMYFFCENNNLKKPKFRVLKTAMNFASVKVWIPNNKDYKPAVGEDTTLYKAKLNACQQFIVLNNLPINLFL